MSSLIKCVIKLHENNNVSVIFKLFYAFILIDRSKAISTKGALVV